MKQKQNKWKNPMYAYKRCMADKKKGSKAWDLYRSMKKKTNPFIKVKKGR